MCPGATRKDPVDAVARRRLGIERLVLGIHEPSFPGDDDEDVGRGTPYGRAAGRFLAAMQGLGFDAVQLGPDGQTSRDNASPYDGALFERNFLSLALLPLVERELLSARTLEAAVAGPAAGRSRADHRRAWDATSAAIDEAYRAHLARGGPPGRGAFVQAELAHQHGALRSAHPGLRLYGDMQIGMCPEDAAALRSLCLQGYLLGAPPSRTTPEGQPWGYPVFDPRARPAVERLLRDRVRRLMDRYDGLRIDHPHGLVCPWVYRPGEPVARGARLHESPDLADHPELAPLALARADQIDRSVPRYHDRWVRNLDDAQVQRYAASIDLILEEVAAAGGSIDDVVCEVLSTLPYPLARVLARHGLGRFRVVQKLSLSDPDDVYRIERAEPADWIMVGNHDTPPIWAVVERWQGGPLCDGWARYLSDLLAPEAQRAALAARLAADPDEMVHAIFAAVLASRARHVSIFFADLYGLRESYNVPGTVDDANWSLRVPPDWETRGPALDLSRCFAMALTARGLHGGPPHA